MSFGLQECRNIWQKKSTWKTKSDAMKTSTASTQWCAPLKRKQDELKTRQIIFLCVCFDKVLEQPVACESYISSHHYRGGVNAEHICAQVRLHCTVPTSHYDEFRILITSMCDANETHGWTNACQAVYVFVEKIARNSISIRRQTYLLLLWFVSYNQHYGQGEF